MLFKSKYEGIDKACNTTSSPTIKYSYTYDLLGRIDSQTARIGASNYVQSQSYDSYSRPHITTYPQGTESVAAKTQYNSYGYQYKTSRVSDNYLLSEVQSMNSRGQVTIMKNGNLVTTEYGYDAQTGWMDTIDVAKGSALLHYLDVGHDLRGNVKTRRSHYASSTGIGSDFTERYAYDILNRLRTRTIGVVAGANALPSAFKTTQAYNYDNWGNFTFKTGAGYYKYDTTKVHKLLGVYANPNFTGTKYAFGYDANGNVTTDGTRAFNYDSFDKPTRIAKGNATSDMKYGVDRELYYKDDNYIENGKNVRYRRYYMGAYEKVVRTGGNGNMTEHKYNIGNALLTYRAGSNTTSFVHKDNQGSVISTTDHLGKVTSQAIYDPFGKQSEVYRSSAYITTYPPITDIGYTGHKQMNHVDIIHMGGRIYDPILGRFLQADPFIQAPKDSQNYNRYSYVMNNPMSYTDPSGFGAWSKFRDNILEPVVAIAISVWTVGGAAGYGLSWAGFGIAAAGGAATGFVLTGTLKGALTGAFSAAAFFGVGQTFGLASGDNLLAAKHGIGTGGIYDFGGLGLTLGQIAGQISSHAALGGAIADLNGGKFGHGFFSAGFTKAAGGTLLPSGRENVFKGAIASAVIGGTTSRISGGKFTNGARTGAFQYLFNQASKSIEPGGRLNPVGEKFLGAVVTKVNGQWMYVPIEMVADIKLAEATRTSIGEYTRTTNEDVAKGLSYTGGVLATIGTGGWAYLGWATLGGAAWLDPTIQNQIGAVTGPFSKLMGPLDEVFYPGTQTLETTINNVGHINDAVTFACDIPLKCN